MDGTMDLYLACLEWRLIYNEGKTRDLSIAERQRLTVLSSVITRIENATGLRSRNVPTQAAEDEYKDSRRMPWIQR